jgi:hypothetical protein
MLVQVRVIVVEDCVWIDLSPYILVLPKNVSLRFFFREIVAQTNNVEFVTSKLVAGTAAA